MRVRALYNDGRSAASHRVTVAVDPSGLAIMNANDQRVSMWPAAGLELVERPTGRSPFRLSCGGAPPRLTFAAPVIDSFAEYYPDLDRRGAVGLRSWLQMGGWAAGALVFAIVAWLLAAPLAAQYVAALIPDSAKARLGTQLSGQVVAAIAGRDGRVYDDMFCYDEASTGALQQLFSVLAQGPAAGARYGLLAIRGNQPAVLALPGGQIVMSGAVAQTAGSAEALAGILAHEIGHVVADHPLRTMVQWDPVAVLFSLMPLDDGTAAFDASLAAQFLDEGYRESHEEDADAFALRVLNEAGIVAGPYTDFRAARLDADEDTAGPLALMHPVSDDSVDLLREGGTGTYLALEAAQWQVLSGLCG